MKIIGLLDPQPPATAQIVYMLGGESWRPENDRSPIRLHCESWGNLGPLELNPDIQENSAGFRVKSDDILAPAGALGITVIDGLYYWIDQKYLFDFVNTPADKSERP